MLSKITLALVLILCVAFLGHLYNEESMQEKALTTKWKEGSQLVIEQDIKHLKERLADIEFKLK